MTTAILTKYHGPTNTRRSRVSATWGTDRTSVEYDSAGGFGEPAHRKAAEAVLRKTGYPQFIGRLVGGALPDGRYVFVVGP
jgi:hypothetical protein